MVPGWWLVITRPVGLAVGLAVSTHGMIAALAWGIPGVPQPRLAQRRCHGAPPTGAAFSAQPCEVGKGGKGGRVRSLEVTRRKPNV